MVLYDDDDNDGDNDDGNDDDRTAEYMRGEQEDLLFSFFTQWSMTKTMIMAITE